MFTDNFTLHEFLKIPKTTINIAVIALHEESIRRQA